MPTAVMVGGKQDGMEITIPPRVKIPEEVLVPSKTYFALAEDREEMSIMTGPLNSRWHSLDGHVYQSEGKKDDHGRHVFRFVRSRMIERCHAATKNQKWCRNEAEEDGHLCKTHLRQEPAPELYLKEDGM